MLETLAQIEVREAGQGATTCQGKNEGICFDYIIDNLGDYVEPTLRHLYLVGISVVAGLVIALGLAVLSHRRRWLMPVFVGGTGILYTIPSIALFLILLPVTGRGVTTALIALTLYNLQIIYRNALAGLANVPGSSRDAGLGMGMTDRQLLWRVEMPLAVPEIVAGGLGEVIYTEGINRDVFKTAIAAGSFIAIAMAIGFDGLLLVAQRLIAPWRQARTI